MQESAARRRDATERGLRRCLAEGDAAAAARSRRRRCQALLVSLAAQAGLLAALVLVPLVATSERVFALRMTPLPLPLGSLHGKPHANSGAGGPRQTKATGPSIYDRLSRPPQFPHPGAGSQRSPGPGLDEPLGFGIPGGVDPQGAGADTRWIGPPGPPAETQKNRVVRSEGVQQAFLTQRVQPVYPPLAVQMRLEGTVQLHAIIGRDGAVTALEALSGHSILAQAALEAVRQWRYRPTLLNGKPVEVETYITVIFQLQR